MVPCCTRRAHGAMRQRICGSFWHSRQHRNVQLAERANGQKFDPHLGHHQNAQQKVDREPIISWAISDAREKQLSTRGTRPEPGTGC
jgi:hypothetical protein